MHVCMYRCMCVVCMCAFMHAYVCVHACVHVHMTYACVRARVCMYLCMFVCMYVCMCVCMCVHACICVCMCVCMSGMCACAYDIRVYVCTCACLHACACMHACVCACMYVCMHVCVCVCCTMFVKTTELALAFFFFFFCKPCRKTLGPAPSFSPALSQASMGRLASSRQVNLFPLPLLPQAFLLRRLHCRIFLRAPPMNYPTREQSVWNREATLGTRKKIPPFCVLCRLSIGWHHPSRRVDLCLAAAPRDRSLALTLARTPTLVPPLGLCSLCCIAEDFLQMEAGVSPLMGVNHSRLLLMPLSMYVCMYACMHEWVCVCIDWCVGLCMQASSVMRNVCMYRLVCWIMHASSFSD
jgi:hypothetical protein